MNIWTETLNIFNHSNSRRSHFNSIRNEMVLNRMRNEWRRKKYCKYKWNNIIPYNILILRVSPIVWLKSEHSLFEYEYFLNLYKQFLLLEKKKNGLALLPRQILLLLVATVRCGVHTSAAWLVTVLDAAGGRKNYMWKSCEAKLRVRHFSFDFKCQTLKRHRCIYLGMRRSMLMLAVCWHRWGALWHSQSQLELHALAVVTNRFQLYLFSTSHSLHCARVLTSSACILNSSAWLY